MAVTVIGRLSLSSSSLTTELPPAGKPVSRSAVLRAKVRIGRAAHSIGDRGFALGAPVHASDSNEWQYGPT
jgi:hypothetical protein